MLVMKKWLAISLVCTLIFALGSFNVYAATFDASIVSPNSITINGGIKVKFTANMNQATLNTTNITVAGVTIKSIAIDPAKLDECFIIFQNSLAYATSYTLSLVNVASATSDTLTKDIPFTTLNTPATYTGDIAAFETNFQNDTVGNVPTSNSILIDNPGGIIIKVTNDPLDNSNKVVQLGNDTVTGTKANQFYKKDLILTNKTVIQYRFMTSAISTNHIHNLYWAGTVKNSTDYNFSQVEIFRATGNQFFASGAGGLVLQSTPLVANNWYTINIVVDHSTGKGDFYINGVLGTTGYQLYDTVDYGTSKINLRWNDTHNKDVGFRNYFDDVSVKSVQSLKMTVVNSKLVDLNDGADLNFSMNLNFTTLTPDNIKVFSSSGQMAKVSKVIKFTNFPKRCRLIFESPLQASTIYTVNPIEFRDIVGRALVVSPTFTTGSGSFPTATSIINRDFTGLNIGTSLPLADFPGQWFQTGTGLGVQLDPQDETNTNKVYAFGLKPADNSTWGYFYRDMNMTNKTIIDFKIMSTVNDLSGTPGQVTFNGNPILFSLYNGYLTAGGVSTIRLLETPFVKGAWYRIRIVFNPETSTADYYLGGTKVLADIPISTSTVADMANTNLRFLVTLYKYETGKIYYDDFNISQSNSVSMTETTSTNIPLATGIDVDFDKSMDNNTMNPLNFVVYSNSNEKVNIQSIVADATVSNRYKFTFASTLKTGTTYTIYPIAGKDIYGNIPATMAEFTTIPAALTINPVKVYNGEVLPANEIFNLQSGALTAQTTITNTKNPSQNATMVIALYDGIKLIGLSAGDVIPVAFNTSEVISESLSVDLVNVVNPSLKIFLWNGLSDMNSLKLADLIVPANK